MAEVRGVRNDYSNLEKGAFYSNAPFLKGIEYEHQRGN